MAAQEAVSRLAVVDDQQEGVSLGALNVWRTAEAYYQGNDFPLPLLTCAETTITDEAMVADVGSSGAAGAEHGGGGTERPGTHLVACNPIIAQSPLSTAGAASAAFSQTTAGSEPTSAYDPKPTRADVKSGKGDASDGHVEAQLHPRELVQDEFPPAPSTPVTPKKAVLEREPSIVHILPPPSKRTAGETPVGASGSSDRTKRADYARTPFEVHPPISRRTVQPIPPVVSPYETRSYADSAEAVRRRAEIRAEERRRRIEARKWLGYSPLRPPVGATPFMGGDSTRPAIIIVPYVVHHRD